MCMITMLVIMEMIIEDDGGETLAMMSIGDRVVMMVVTTVGIENVLPLVAFSGLT